MTTLFQVISINLFTKKWRRMNLQGEFPTCLASFSRKLNKHFQIKRIDGAYSLEIGKKRLKLE